MPLTRSTSVCALIPHYECHDWLAGAIESLLAQTRRPDAIVVIDDASATPPIEVVSRYPSVTLLVTSENAGPYRLIQTVIDQTDFDAYLFQDADDLSHPDRLETLLATAEQQGADMVGSAELELEVAAPEVRRRDFPLDVNAALAEDPTAFALLHPTSLVSRATVVRANGFPGLPFGGDVDLLWRARHVARIVNADRPLYVRRRHPRSLTGAPTTGTRSPARRSLDRELRGRARANACGEPDLSPFAPCEPVRLRRVSGPVAGAATGAAVAPSFSTPSRRGPVLIVGGPRNGGDVLAWALDRHPHFEVVADIASASSRRRPVVAGLAVTARVIQLADEHPAAQVVYVDRDVESTVASLASRPDTPDDFYSPESARGVAIRMNAMGDAAAATLGPERVHRIGLADLIEEPHACLEAVLAFLGAPRTGGLAWPLTGLPIHAEHRPPAPPLESPLPVADEPLGARLRRLVAAHVNGAAVVAVVSKGDPSLVELGGVQARHFPATDGGVYAGEYPATGTDAVELVERARADGVTHLLLPAPAGWWVTHYAELGEHLATRSRAVAAREDTGTLYDLTVGELVH
jgi:hypothetical protein